MKKADKCTTFSYSMFIILLLSMAGCAPVISKQIRDQVKPEVTFAEVLKDPERYKGQMIILSGTVIKTENTKEGTLIQVLQRPSGFRGEPKDVDETGGRFLALDSRYLDSDVFAKGRSVTVAGEVQGKRILPLDEIEYSYPLILVKELYLWPIEKPYYSPYSPYPPYYYYYPDYWWWQGYFVPMKHHHPRKRGGKTKKCSTQLFLKLPADEKQGA